MVAEKEKKEKKILGIVILALILLVAYASYSTFLKGEVVGHNDIVEINYIAWLEDSGVVFATTIVNEYNITTETELDSNHRYRPMNITIGPSPPSKGTLKAILGLEEGLIGMKEGEVKIITIPPEKGYEVDPDKLVETSRTLGVFEKEQSSERNTAVNREVTISEEQYLSTYGKNAEVDDVVNLGSWSGTVTKISNNTVDIRGDPVIGTVIETKPWDLEVTSVTSTQIILSALAVAEGEYENAYGTIKVDEVTDDKIKFYQTELFEQIETVYGMADIIDNGDSFTVFINPEEGKVISTQAGYAVIKNVDDTVFTLDYNPIYVGKTLVYKVKVEKILKAEN